jgi:MFS family permease
VYIRGSFNQAPSETTGRRNILQDVKEGLGYVLRHPVLRNISIMMALVNFIGATIQAQLVLFGQTQLGASYTQVAWLYTASSAGVVVMGLLAGVLRKRWSFSVVALGALMCNGVLTVVFSQMRWFWPALAVWGLAGGLGILFNINTSSLRQSIVPNHMLARVMSIAGVLAWSAIPLGSVLGGFAIEQTHNVRLVYFVIGVLTIVVPFIFSFTALGHAERYIPSAGARSEAEEAPAPQAGIAEAL